MGASACRQLKKLLQTTNDCRYTQKKQEQAKAIFKKLSDVINQVFLGAGSVMASSREYITRMRIPIRRSHNITLWKYGVADLNKGRAMLVQSIKGCPGSTLPIASPTEMGVE